MLVSEQQLYLVEPAVTMEMKFDCQQLPLGAWSHISPHRNCGSNLNGTSLFFLSKHRSMQVVESHYRLGHVLPNVILLRKTSQGQYEKAKHTGPC